MAHEDQVLADCLGHEHSVEGILVIIGEGLQDRAVTEVQREMLQAPGLDFLFEVLRRGEFSQPFLNGDFDSRYRADENRVVRVTDGLFRFGREAFGIGQHPKKDVRIQQVIHEPW